MELKPIEYEDGMVIETGKYYLNMPNETYHKHKSVSKSGLDTFEIDPYKFYNKKEKEQTRPMQVGSAIHAATLEPEVFAKDFIMLPEVKNRQQPEYKAAVKSFGVGNVFAAKECEKIEGMQKAVWAHDEARRLLKAQGYCEISGFARDNETGTICRHRFDKLAKLEDGWWGVDLKKTQDVREFKFSRTISDYRYHVQDAFYSDQFEWITGEKLAGFKFIAVEEEYPHKVAVYELCDISKQIGKEAYRHNLNMYAEYESGAIKAHNNSGSEVISLPEWVLRQFEEEVI